MKRKRRILTRNIRQYMMERMTEGKVVGKGRNERQRILGDYNLAKLS